MIFIRDFQLHEVLNVMRIHITGLFMALITELV